MTPKMMGVLNFIKKYIKKHNYCPTFQEMCDGLGYKSKNSITNLFAKACFTKIFFYKFAHLISGCSVARLSRLVWDEEVAGSNPATPTD